MFLIYLTVSRRLASVEEKVLSFVQNCRLLLGKPWIVGFTEEQTIPSLLIDFVPDKTWVDFCNMADTVNCGRVQKNQTSCYMDNWRSDRSR
jgi:hypothetical protein